MTIYKLLMKKSKPNNLDGIYEKLKNLQRDIYLLHNRIDRLEILNGDDVEKESKETQQIIEEIKEG